MSSSRLSSAVVRVATRFSFRFASHFLSPRKSLGVTFGRNTPLHVLFFLHIQSLRKVSGSAKLTMSLVCPLCGDFTVAKHGQLMTHIRVMHADDPNFMIQCDRQGCKRTFRKFAVYRNHIYAFHDTTEDTGETSDHANVDPSITNEHQDTSSGEVFIKLQCIMFTCTYTCRARLACSF